MTANCETSAAFVEPAARLAAEYIDRTYGLDTIEQDKLNLLGPYTIS